MKRRQFILVLAVGAFVIFVPAAVFAQSPPPFPAVYGGTARIDGALVPENTSVTAQIEGRAVASAVVLRGHWALMIAQPPGREYRGKVVEFLIDGRKATETRIWKPNGGMVRLNVWSGVKTPRDAFATLIRNNNLLRVWHFDRWTQKASPHYGWYLYDPRPTFREANTLDSVRPGEIYILLVSQAQVGVNLDGTTVDLYQGWNPIKWPRPR